MKTNTLILLNILIVLFCILAISPNIQRGISYLMGFFIVGVILVEIWIIRHSNIIFKEEYNPPKETHIAPPPLPITDERNYDTEYKYPSDFVSTDYWPEDKPYPFKRTAKRKAQRLQPITIHSRRVAQRKAQRK